MMFQHHLNPAGVEYRLPRVEPADVNNEEGKKDDVSTSSQPRRGLNIGCRGWNPRKSCAEAT